MCYHTCNKRKEKTHYEEEFERFENENGKLDIEAVDAILEEKFGVSCGF